MQLVSIALHEKKGYKKPSNNKDSRTENGTAKQNCFSRNRAYKSQQKTRLQTDKNGAAAVPTTHRKEWQKHMVAMAVLHSAIMRC